MPTSVLLVEDNADDSTLICRVLSRSRRRAFTVEHAATLSAAIERMRDATFDAAVVDLRLPDSDGLATFTAIQAAAPDVAIVVLTGEDREEVGLRAVELGAQEYLVKSERALQALPLSIAYACERGRREQEIQELTLALANAVDAIATIDQDGLCVAVNRAFERLLGYGEKEVIGASIIELLHDADRPRFVEMASSAQPLGAHSVMQEIEVRAVRKNGRLLSTQLSLAPRARRRGYFCFLRDLTLRRQAEGRLAAGAALTAVGSLAGGLTHEINNPLSVVLANLEEAVRVIDDLRPLVDDAARLEVSELRTMLEESHAASQRVQRVVRDLRAFAGTEDRTTPLDLNALIESCCNVAIAQIRHRARLVRDLTASTPVVGNQAKLAQVFLNLLVNAAHAMPEHEVDRNEIRITTRQEGRAAVVIEVSDTGAGIPPAYTGLIFDPYFTTRPRRPGMGLAICQATVEQHGGEIAVEPREGGGTLVRVVLPTRDATATDAQAGGQAVHPRRILIVDDDPLVLRSLTRVLARDFEVAAASNGREALDLVRAGETFDAMLCDLMMPELSGIELHELLARDEPELARRMIFLTGGAFSGRAQSFLEAVGQPHLEKPVDLKTVRDLILELSDSAKCSS